MRELPPLAEPQAALAALLERLQPVDTERVPLSQAAGRVLAEPVVADRDAPACDVSAMDGYAFRLADVTPGATLPVTGEAAAGAAPPELRERGVVRIFTGAPVPDMAEAVVPREQVEERPDAITLPHAFAPQSGQHIRRRGENVKAGAPLASPGLPITAATVAAMATVGCVQPLVYRRVRVAVLCTGDEVLPADTASPQPWQVRDSNGPALVAMLHSAAWLEVAEPRRVPDDPAELAQAMRQMLAESDALLITGGVSVGDRDHTPAVLAEVGCRIVYHRLRMRPGKPNLGALGPRGQAVLGLPGNPVSVLVGARRLGAATLRKLAGAAKPVEEPPIVEVRGDDKTLSMWWYRPVRLNEGAAHLAAVTSSGDAVGIAASDGFVEVAPDAPTTGRWPFYRWSFA